MLIPIPILSLYITISNDLIQDAVVLPMRCHQFLSKEIPDVKALKDYRIKTQEWELSLFL